MSDLFGAWPAAKPSPGFAERVAKKARRERLARRARRVAGAVAAFSFAMLAALLVRGTLRYRAEAAAIRSDALDVTVPWPLAPGWDVAQFDFPLAFAPEIANRGAVSLHFTPEFSSPGKPGYWGYVTVWLSDSMGTPGAPDLARLELDLRSYYTGLCGKNGHPFIHTRSPGWVSQSATFTSVALTAEERALGRSSAFRGEVAGLDCITTGMDLSLNVDAVAGVCANGTPYVAYAISPRPPEDPIWAALRAERRKFDCRTR